MPPLPYKIDVQQGNVITQEMVEKLKPGMTKSQVRFVLGSPLIVDTFRDNRWDYVYRLKEKGNLIEQQRLTIFFEGDRLVNIDKLMLSTGSPKLRSKPIKSNPIPAQELTQPGSESGQQDYPDSPY